MKKYMLMTLATVVASAALAQKGKTPPLPQPPPYGAYFLDPLRQDRTAYKAAQQAIAEHYGYKNPGEARLACLRTKTAGCSADIVAHKRHESPELAKYGFKTWREAVAACSKGMAREFGPYAYCAADPFLKLRTKP